MKSALRLLLLSTAAEGNRIELYDLSRDVGEQHELSQELPDVARELDESLEQQLNAMHARRALPASE